MVCDALQWQQRNESIFLIIGPSPSRDQVWRRKGHEKKAKLFLIPFKGFQLLSSTKLLLITTQTHIVEFLNLSTLEISRVSTVTWNKSKV